MRNKNHCLGTGKKGNHKQMLQAGELLVPQRLLKRTLRGIAPSSSHQQKLSLSSPGECQIVRYWRRSNLCRLVTYLLISSSSTYFNYCPPHCSTNACIKRWRTNEALALWVRVLCCITNRGLKAQKHKTCSAILSQHYVFLQII